MVEQPIQVDVQIAGRDVPAGALWTHRHERLESAFEHEQSTAARKLVAAQS